MIVKRRVTITAFRGMSMPGRIQGVEGQKVSWSGERGREKGRGWGRRRRRRRHTRARTLEEGRPRSRAQANSRRELVVTWFMAVKRSSMQMMAVRPEAPHLDLVALWKTFSSSFVSIFAFELCTNCFEVGQTWIYSCPYAVSNTSSTVPPSVNMRVMTVMKPRL